MPTHIDHIITEVFSENPPEQQVQGGDARWQEIKKIEALLKQQERHYQRLRAEGFDD